MKTDDTDKERLFLEMIDSNRALISKVCYMYAVDRDHFKDLYQDALVNLWRGFDTFRGEAARSTWIYRVAINSCQTEYRHSRRSALNDNLDDHAELADQSVDRPSQLREMYRLISKLGRMDKALIMLWLDEKSYDEIAEITGLTRNNVATRLRRAKAKLVEAGDS